MGSDSGGGDQEITIRYASYIEDKHKAFLTTVASNRTTIAATSPFDGYTDVTIDDAFFGTGYVISSFPSLYDMYGKFLAGLDVDVLYTQILEDSVNAPTINNLVSAEAALLEDDIEQNILPDFETGAQNINSVMSSTFVIGKALIEETRAKLITKFSTELKYRMLPVAADRWKTHLSWNKDVIMVYAEIMKLYFSARMDVDDHNYSMAAKDSLWPFTVLDYERAALGALQGATNTNKAVAGASQEAKAISGALSGAATGAMVTGGNPWGAVAGGLLGLGASFL